MMKKSRKWHVLRFKIAVKMALITVSFPLYYLFFYITKENVSEIYIDSLVKDWEKIKKMK